MALKELYNRRFDGKNYDIELLLKDIKTNYDEAVQIGKALASENLIKFIQTKDGISAQIIHSGIEYIEEEEYFKSNYEPRDFFSSEEKIEIIKRLSQFEIKLKRIEIGQEITYNDIHQELDELKHLLTVLGKKNWVQVFKGKLIDAGLGSLTEEVAKIVVETFNDNQFIAQ